MRNSEMPCLGEFKLSHVSRQAYPGHGRKERRLGQLTAVKEGKRYTVILDGKGPDCDLKPGDRVTIHGVRLNEIIVATASNVFKVSG